MSKSIFSGIELVNDLKAEIKEAFVAQVNANLQKIPPEQMIEKAQDLEDEDFVMDDQDFLIKVHKLHDFHPGLSSKITVKYNEQKGRYTVAKEDIKVGDVLAVEDANVSFTHHDRTVSKACHECVNVLRENKHPSPVLDGIYFCSFACMNKAMSTYHKHERNILKDYIEQTKENANLEQSGCLFLALKAISKEPWQFYCQGKRKEMFLRTDPTFGINENQDNLSLNENKILHLFNLVQHEDQIPSEERIKTAIRATTILESLKQSGYFVGLDLMPDKLTEEEHVIGVLLYKLQLGITYNVHLIYKVSGDLSGGIPLEMVGSGVYHNCVMLNHSCAANTTRIFQVIYLTNVSLHQDFN